MKLIRRFPHQRGKWIGDDPFHNRIHCMVLPYLKGLIVIKEILHIVLVYMLWCFCIQSLVLKKWYQSTFLGQSCGQIFLFLQIFFFGEEKRGPWHSRHFQYISMQNLQKRVVYLSSSQKNTQVEKKIIRNGVRKVKILKFYNLQFFRVFSADGGAICFYLCSILRSNLPK